MGSQTPEEKAVKEKIENLQQIIDTAYILFDGKYSIEYISSMPYKKLISYIEHEEKLPKELEEIKTARKVNRMMGSV